MDDARFDPRKDLACGGTGYIGRGIQVDHLLDGFTLFAIKPDGLASGDTESERLKTLGLYQNFLGVYHRFGIHSARSRI